MAKSNAERRITIWKAGVCALLFVMLTILSAGIFGVRAGAVIPINNANDLINYAAQYAAGYHSDDDVLQFVISSGMEIDLTGEYQGNSFVGIGTVGRPFKGTIRINNDVDMSIKANRALFAYVSTEAKIENASGTVRELVFKRADIGTDAPLFADVVTNSAGNTANWKITVDDYEENTNHYAHPFAGAIGTIEAGAKVNVEFTHESRTTSTANISSANNVGLICGTMGDGAELSVTIGSGVTGYSITSTGGHAGGLVGEMGAGAKLTLNTAYADDTGGVFATASGKHAGGLVGVMGDGAEIVLGVDYTSGGNVTSSSGYAGGVAGHATNAKITFNNHDINITTTLSGGSSGGAGGVYGYLSCTTDNDGTADSVRTFDLTHIKSDNNFTLAKSGNTNGGNTGGVFGMLDATVNVTIDGNTTHTKGNKDTFDRSVKLNGGTSRGGIIGNYKTNSLANTLIVKNVKVNSSTSGSNVSGGIIGRISGDGSAAYVKIADVAVKNSGDDIYGGLVGGLESNGSFLDIEGLAAFTGKCNSGIVRYQNNGVVRFKGITDVGGAYYFGSAATCSGAQLIGSRGKGLVYALGSGADEDPNNATDVQITSTGDKWTFCHTTSKVDDIGDWGEVLRNITESTFFTVDMGAHTVTMAGAVNPMTNITDFIKTALNIQHNVGGLGALQFADTTNTSAVLLRTNLSISNDINLSGTGIVELTRDNGSNNAYTGTFEGNNHTITLAIGEAYGKKNNGDPPTSGDNPNGTVIAHQHLALFAKAQGATFQNLTIDGSIYTDAAGGGRIGGVVSDSKNNLTLTNIKTSQTTNVYESKNNQSVYCGGAVGQIETGSTGTISISGSNFNTVINDGRTDANDGINCGGAIGYVASTGSLTFNVDTVSLGGTYSKTNATGGEIKYGGLIGVFYPAATNAGSNTRTVNLTNITVANSANINFQNKKADARSTSSGAFIGCKWPNVDVTIGTDGSEDGITIGTAGDGTPAITVASGSTSGNVGVLFYKGTGLWKVNHVKVNKANITTNYGTSTFGFIVNDGAYNETFTEKVKVDGKDTDVNVNYKSALYLELVSEKYDIAATSISGNFATAFDEIVGFSKFYGTDLADNGQAIVSIRLPDGEDEGTDPDPVIMTGSACNTYQNQTSYATKINPNTRYYYNLDSIRAKASPTPAEKLLMWSVNKYAHSSVKDCFTNGFTNNTISGNCDMVGLSYYPVDASGMTISAGTTIKFYNNEIETGEAGTGNSDSSVRSTRITVNESQHRLMHEGVFRNYTGTLTVNGLTVQGNVSNQNTGYSGFLICGNYGGAESTSNITMNNIVLDGAYISGRTGGDYAPLLINSIDKNVKLTLTGVSTSNYPNTPSTDPTVPVASSLIGNVGYDTASNINLTFSDIRLDARTTALSGNSGLDTAYGTTRSIFDRATLLEKFQYQGGSRGEYNYTHAEDWTNSQHNVTYGYEVSESTEYPDKENKYYTDATHYTSPTSDNKTDAEYDFSTGFLPYVHVGYNTTNKTHELRVNVSEVGLTSGCGQYNDPYNINDGGALETVANIIAGNTIPTDLQITLPTDMTAADMWCAETTAHRTYTYKKVNSTTKFYAGASNEYSYTVDEVREYLAGAYYNISGTITLGSATYVGLGYINSDTGTTYENKYAFRGVIVGGGTVINKSANPLIKSANGCVVKDITVQVGAEGAGNGVTIEINQAAINTFKYGNVGCMSYGAVIGQVMGGDNIIDKVGVDLTYATFTVAGNAYDRLVPVGGYVGVVVNGGVIFRHMSDAEFSATPDNKKGITKTKFSNVTDDGWLYINPIIGRVIAGYAFTEAGAYEYIEASVTMKNTVKNYGICDLNQNSANKLVVNATAANAHTISAPDAQALYILSCIVNSGAGSASYNASTEQAYATIADTPWIAYRNYTQTRCGEYDEVGTSAAADGDYATVAAQDVYSGSTKVPYIIRQYTSSDSGTFKARSICTWTTTAKDNSNKNEKTFRLAISSDATNKRYSITDGKYTQANTGIYAELNNYSAVTTITLANTTYYLPAGYRGIGSIYESNCAVQLRFNKLDGNNATINLQMQYVDYNHQSGKSSTDVPNGTNGFGTTVYWTGADAKNENYIPFDDAGFGFFNNLYICDYNADGRNYVKEVTLTGSVKYDYKIMYASNHYIYANTVINGVEYSAGQYVDYPAGRTPLYTFGYNFWNDATYGKTGYYPDVADRVEAKNYLHSSLR